MKAAEWDRATLEFHILNKLSEYGVRPAPEMPLVTIDRLVVDLADTMEGFFSGEPPYPPVTLSDGAKRKR